MADLRDVLDSPDPRAAFARWFQANRPRIAKAAISISLRVTGSSPSPEDLDELVQESALAVWLAVTGYRWICPGCRSRHESEAGYRDHVVACCGAYREPVASLDRRAYYLAGNAAQRALKRATYGADMMRRKRATRADLDDVLRCTATATAELTRYDRLLEVATAAGRNRR